VHKNLLEMERLQVLVSQLEEKVLTTQEKIELFESQINERRTRLRELDEKLGEFDIAQLRSRLEQFEAALEKASTEIQELTSHKEDHIKEMGRLENEIKRLDGLENDLKVLENKMEYLKAVYEDAESLEAMYVRIRAELRARNIDALDSLINEIFSFMYSNNAYSHIRLDPEYNLTIYEKDGTALEPKLLSGGERALFNLVLRCAIYRLLAMGVGGRASDLPPLILDEPTVFLDRGHIQQLIKLIDMMRNIGVGQIIIVSHDETLIDSADHVFRVEKDPITNTSAIYGR
jgi:exonuclease SbcC